MWCSGAQVLIILPSTGAWWRRGDVMGRVDRWGDEMTGGGKEKGGEREGRKGRGREQIMT